MKILFIAICLITISLKAEQQILVVECEDGKAQISLLQKMVKEGWKVIVATPVTESDSIQMIGKPKQAYTSEIIYILEK